MRSDPQILERKMERHARKGAPNIMLRNRRDIRRNYSGSIDRPGKGREEGPLAVLFKFRDFRLRRGKQTKCFAASSGVGMRGLAKAGLVARLASQRATIMLRPSGVSGNLVMLVRALGSMAMMRAATKAGMQRHTHGDE